MMDYENILSRKVQNLQFSGIRKFFDIAASYDDVISLSVGEPDFKTPWAIRKEAIRVLEKGRTNYTANAGLADLRIAINDYINDRLHVSYDPLHEILVTVGGWVMERYGGIPPVGEVIRFKFLEIKVVKTTKQKVLKIRSRRVDEEAEEDESAEAKKHKSDE